MANKVALGSILSLMYGYTKIVIEDRKHKDVYIDNSPDTKRWEGFVKDIWKASDEITYKWLRTSVYQIWHKQDYILFLISTEFEKY
jgi:hypothetical protein